MTERRRVRRARRPRQQSFVFPSRGGRRPGAGRPRTRAGTWVEHTPRPRVDPRQPLHVTVKMSEGVPWLRRRDRFRVIRRALIAAKQRSGFRICHYSVQSNHVHLIVEAIDRIVLARGMQSFGIRVAKGLNRQMSRRGRVWRDRYHAVALRTPAQVRAALCYVLNNARRHRAREAGERGWMDPFSSAAAFDGWRAASRRVRGPALEISVATTWLLKIGWMRRGLIGVDEVPAAARA